MVPARSVLTLLLAAASGLSPEPEPLRAPAPERAPWTILFYGAGNSSAEPNLMYDLARLARVHPGAKGCEFVLLVDRIDGHSSADAPLSGDFTDTRLFHLRNGKAVRIPGGIHLPAITETSRHDANTGHPETLRGFIRLGKERFPADRYALILYGHGECRSVCPDLDSPCLDSGEAEDPLFTAEISEGLGPGESVDLLCVDACSFAAVENAYQFRPGNGRFEARVMVASPVVGQSLPYDLWGTIGAAAEGSSSGTLDAEDLGRRIVRHTAAYLDRYVEAHPEHASDLRDEAWVCLDLSRMDRVKQAVDRFAMALWKANARSEIARVRGSGDDPVTLNYLCPAKRYPWLSTAHFDLHDLCRRIASSDQFGVASRTAAQRVIAAVQELVLDSFAREAFPGFEPGTNGIYIVFPDGDATIGARRHWEFFDWYHPGDRRRTRAAFGNYAWCRDGATAGNRRVENWFELLDAWYDVGPPGGGSNGYSW